MPPSPPGPGTGATRIQSLDGLRALSILLVIYGHARATQGFPDTERLHQAIRLGNVAHFGVRVFFVISGFLITSLLVSEIRKTGTIGLGAFYLKRAFRIFPAYYFYLAAVSALALVGAVPLPWIDLVLAATYTINYQGHRSWWVGHAWSLSVEEQFYLLWPLAFRASGIKRGLTVASAVVLAAPVLRVGWALIWVTKEQRFMIQEAFPTVADALAMGCALALLRPRLDASERYTRLLRSPLTPWLAFGTAYASVAGIERHVWWGWAMGESLLNLSIAVIVHRYVRFPDGRMGRILNSRPAVLVGMMSYSLYLWQQPFMQQAVAGKDMAFWLRFPQNLGFAAAAAAFSYYLVEKPFLRLRERLVDRPRKAAAAPLEG